MKNLNSELIRVKEIGYDHCSFLLSDLVIESESKEYKACTFRLDGRYVICRNSKITPKKIGQFVTFWKRNKENIIEPFDENDQIDFYIINVIKENRLGQFVFPKSVLIDNKIISSTNKEGKRGFRVYPKWDAASSKQAKKTQEWQTKYFIEFDNEFDLGFFKKLYQRN